MVTKLFASTMLLDVEPCGATEKMQDSKMQHKNARANKKYFRLSQI